MRHSGTPALVIQPFFSKMYFTRARRKVVLKTGFLKLTVLIISSNVDVYMSRYCNKHSSYHTVA